MKKFVAYYRVSTKQQKSSGLGIEAQKAAVVEYVKKEGGQTLKQFTEIESGGKTDIERPKLEAAVAYARRARAVLVVAKLDRLARNVAFLSRLMESKVDFVACDNPHANKFTIHILAAVAEWEREQTSLRTKAALAAAKARGIKLGSARPGHWRGREDKRREGARKGNAKAIKVIVEKARAEYADLRPEVERMRKDGSSLRKIARVLNEAGQRTRRNRDFTAVQVSRILGY